MDGSPLNAGLHKMKVHFDNSIEIDWIMFTLIKPHDITPKTLTQSIEGSKWQVAWSDEFDGKFVDTTKWTYDIGNWGWGNGEEQYYTKNRPENARIENGNLIIEARRNDMGQKWTSARLTTRGKVSFVYGRIEMRAKVPHYRGNWAAGWTLGDEYVDEISWPFCGEIDILESVGYEMDDSTGNGIAHASAHSGAYYFKLGNQPTGIIEVENMNNKFHTYAIEWTPEEIRAYLDDQLYFTYNDTSNGLSWPFHKPQNLIINLAMGGGWGGYYGIDENVEALQMIIDYVRVYERK
jgi:beta-glucanase (GH16 family)